MSLKDKLELGLKPDAAYRPDNLPDHQKDDPSCVVAGQPGESPKVERARDACDAGETAAETANVPEDPRPIPTPASPRRGQRP